jgi:transposase
MELERGDLVSPAPEVPVIDGEIVTAIRELVDRGWGSKAIARELGIARNTVRRYRRHPVVAGHQVRAPRRLTEDVVHEAQTLYAGVAERNAVVVHRLLREQGRAIGLRTVQRAVAPVRQAQRAADVATVRVETAPGAQLQIDFGEKRVAIGDTAARVFLLVAVLSYSRRLFVKAFLQERQDDWREGIAAAFVHFGGVTATILGDNARAGARARSRHRDRPFPSGVPGLLPRLGRAASRLPALSRPHQREDGIRREVRQAQCAGRAHLRVVPRARAASCHVDDRSRSTCPRHDP